MDKKTKKELLDLIQDVSYAHEDGNFWKTWSALHKYASDIKTTDERKEIEYDG